MKLLNSIEKITPKILQLVSYRNGRLPANKIDQINQCSENKQSSLAWKTVNEITGRKRTCRAKLKASSQKDRLNQWKGHFQKSSW